MYKYKMLGLKNTRKYLKKRSVPKRRNYRRGRVVRKPSKGFLCVKRKLPEMYVRNNGVGTAIVTDPTGTCITLGAPISDPASATYNIPFSLVFRMDQVINSTDITNLCDQYKLKYLSVACVYQSTQSNVSSTSIMPQITWVTDHDDPAVPASVNELREKMGSKLRTFGYNKPVVIGVQPRVADTIFNNGITSAYAVPKSQWINSQYPGTQHYGIKGILNNVSLQSSATNINSFKFDITATVYGKDFQ